MRFPNRNDIDVFFEELPEIINFAIEGISNFVLKKEHALQFRRLRVAVIKDMDAFEMDLDNEHKVKIDGLEEYADQVDLLC